MGTEVCGGVVEDVDAVAGEAILFTLREPGNVEDLDEVGNAMFAEEVNVVDG